MADTLAIIMHSRARKRDAGFHMTPDRPFYGDTVQADPEAGMWHGKGGRRG